jgi:hypothetical protein
MNKIPIYIILGILIFSASAIMREDNERIHLGFKPEAKYYGVAKWNADSLGNHRAVINVTKKEDAVMVYIPWRRQDESPDKKGIILIDSSTGKRIKNIHVLKSIREYGIFVFQPKTAPGTYYLYYLVPRTKGKNYPKVSYLPPMQTAEAEWLKRHEMDKENPPPDKLAKLTKAEFIQFQSIDEFNSFYPMEIIATKLEVSYIIRMHPDRSFLLFPEDRSNPIRMTGDLPFKWINDDTRDTFTAVLNMGEYFAFQIGLFAARDSISNIEIKYGDCINRSKKTMIPASSFNCFNTGGRDWTGKPFKKVVTVEKRKVQALWFGVTVPPDIMPGKYIGSVTITPEGMKPQTITLIFEVLFQLVDNFGDDKPANHSRLRWLDSELAQDDSVVHPFIPIQANENVLNCLGRELHINDAGLPTAIKSFFSPEVTQVTQSGRDILASPIYLIIEKMDGCDTVGLKTKGLNFIKKSPGEVAWKASSIAGDFSVECIGKLEADGYVDIQLILNAKRNLKVKDIRLEIPFKNDMAKYMMGMGVKGGYRPKTFDWKWDVGKNQDGAWIGDVNAGMQCSFRDENYSRPLNTNFYQLKPLNMPKSWYNKGKGGVRFREINQEKLLLTSYSGDREIKAGEKLHFYFNLLITPFKLLDTRGQFTTRYYHSFKPVSEISTTGANVINVHHATSINPFINYPFLRAEEMKKYIDEAHRAGLKVKIYYTVRELSNHAPELFAIRSLGDEILSHGTGGGPTWCIEHLDQNYIGGWCVPEIGDAALINSGVSRWHNYYVEGLNWIVKNCGIDGLYIDDVAFDRNIMKRVRKILDRDRPGALIDLHSANQFNPQDGFANSANLYLEHFPYINRLWFGEYFDYNASPDFWLIEMSGIPFGLMGEMLQDGGNPWRGMVYGMTSRLPWAGDPRPIWKAMDEFGIHDSRMVGYWSPDSPVKTDNDSVFVTSYVKNQKTMIALANWASKKVDVKLQIDWKYLGLLPERTKIYASAIKDFQPEAEFKPDETISVEPGKGWLIKISAK